MGGNDKIVTLPNVLSISRIILSPLILLMNESRLALFFVILIIGLTDVLDGFFARKFKSQTVIGSRLDSISDFVFYIILVIYALVFDFDIFAQVKYYVLIIIGLKLFTFLSGIIKHRKLSLLHTFGNKISGIMIFLGFCIFILPKNTLILKIGIFTSIICSLEEFLITIIGKKYKENIKGIWEIRKLL
jgi:CDP-diacylglycerol--glycerol-3-phosphate 3-phosphatidyltransferase